jgi:quinol monooxygenase YgiN
MHIYLTAILKSKPGNASVLKDYLKELVIASRKEEACLQYDLHQLTEDENIFIFHEIWADQKGLDLHNSQVHLQHFAQQAGEILDGPVVIYKTDKVS